MKTKPCKVCGKSYVVFERCRPFCSIECRFLAKTERVGACLIWTAGRTADGYGSFNTLRRDAAGKQLPAMRAHRFAYALAHPENPNPHSVMHTCDTPACVEPAHLVGGTHADNMRDMSLKDRAAGRPNSPAVVRKNKLKGA